MKLNQGLEILEGTSDSNRSKKYMEIIRIRKPQKWEVEIWKGDTASLTGHTESSCYIHGYTQNSVLDQTTQYIVQTKPQLASLNKRQKNIK